MSNKASTSPSNLAQQIVDCFDDGVILVNEEWTITSVTPMCLRMIRSGEDWVGKSLWDFLPVNSLYSPCTVQSLRDALETSQTFAFDSYYTHGINRWFRFSVRPAPVGMAVFLRDLTEQHLANARHLQDREAAVNSVVSVLAHRINNPLQALTNLLLLAQRECSEACVRELLTLAECQLLRVAGAANEVFQEHTGKRQSGLPAFPLSRSTP